MSFTHVAPLIKELTLSMMRTRVGFEKEISTQKEQYEKQIEQLKDEKNVCQKTLIHNTLINCILFYPKIYVCIQQLEETLTNIRKERRDLKLELSEKKEVIQF